MFIAITPTDIARGVVGTIIEFLADDHEFTWIDKCNFFIVKVIGETQLLISDARKRKIMIDFEKFPGLSQETLAEYANNKNNIHDPMFIRIKTVVKNIKDEIVPQELQTLFNVLEARATNYPNEFPELALEPYNKFDQDWTHIEFKNFTEKVISQHISRTQYALTEKEFNEKGKEPDFTKVLDLSIPGLIKPTPVSQHPKVPKQDLIL